MTKHTGNFHKKCPKSETPLTQNTNILEAYLASKTWSFQDYKRKYKEYYGHRRKPKSKRIKDRKRYALTLLSGQMELNFKDEIDRSHKYQYRNELLVLFKLLVTLQRKLFWKVWKILKCYNNFRLNNFMQEIKNYKPSLFLPKYLDKKI